MRTIELMVDAVSLHQLREGTDPHMVQEAVGYLASWNLTFEHVTITANVTEKELTACYYREKAEGRPDYVIGAVWHDPVDASDAGHFSFHS